MVMRLFFLFALVIFSQLSLAANYYYVSNNNGPVATACNSPAQFPSIDALGACIASNASPTYQPVTYLGGAVQNLPTYKLNFTVTISNSVSNSSSTANRYGDSCPAGYTLNQAAGRCDKQCATGQTLSSDGQTCSCPAGQALVGGVCSSTCPDVGFGAEKVVDTECKPDCAGRAGRKVGAMWLHETMGGCKVSCVVVVGSAWPVECTYAGSGAGTANGSDVPTSSGAAPPEGSTPKDPVTAPCPAGTSAGTVNGQQYCASDSGSPPSDPVLPGQPQTTSTKSETVETRTSTTTTNSDGSTTTVTRIVVTGTGTETGATSGNSGTGSGGEGGGGESSGGDDCSAPPSCSGDPIMCNILKQDWQMKCLLPDVDHASVLSVIASSGADPNGQIETKEINVLEKMQGIFAVEGGTSSCPAGRTINLTLGTFEVSYDIFCTLAERLRPIVLFLFGFIAFRIFMSSGA